MMKSHKLIIDITVLFVFILLFLPSTALAVQVHGPPEGFIVHLMGHVFFTASLGFLIYILHKYPLDRSPAWTYFKISIFFWLVWNLDTFFVHILSARLPRDAIITGPHLVYSRLKGPFDLERSMYYLGQFDHFLCVPAMYCLAMSLKNFCQRAERAINEEDPKKNIP